MKRWIPNPSMPAGRKPVELITDRAKRYRANRAAPEVEKRCVYCGAPRPRDIDHVDGNEANNNPENLVYACRPCNAKKGAAFARSGRGVRTRQFNPASKGATSLGQWVQAVLALRGEASTMSLPAAVRLVQETPPARRSAFAAEIWRRRRERGTDKQIPF